MDMFGRMGGATPCQIHIIYFEPCWNLKWMELVRCHLSRVLVNISLIHVLINLARQFQCSLCSHFTIYPLRIILCLSVYQTQKDAIWNQSTNLMFVCCMFITFYAHWTMTDGSPRKSNYFSWIVVDIMLVWCILRKVITVANVYP